MKEKDLIKKILEDKLIQKEKIKNAAVSAQEKTHYKGAVFMRKRKVVFATLIAFVILASVSTAAFADMYEYNRAADFLEGINVNPDSLSRKDVKRVYKDIKSDTFEYPITKEVLYDSANEIGINPENTDPKSLYLAIKEYHMCTYTAQITSEQIKAIKKGTSYKDIIKTLGVTKDIGSGLHVLQYNVDGDKILLLSFANENDICNKSGDELLLTLKPAKQDNADKNTFNAFLVSKSQNNILVSCPTNKDFDMISLSITKDTEIVFSDGSKATFEDIEGELTVTISGEIRESYPPQGDAVKIVIKK